ncbi:MAG: Wzz/FepE/Etk N-terminal domain-containing protein, partial [Trueperaceae bacterium]
MYEPRDEISLRELYLIFRAGLVAIVLAALVAGAAAFLYIGSRPASYEATATVQVNVPVADSANEEAAWLLPPAGIGMNSYRALANRPAVIAAGLGVPASNTD